MKTETQNDFDRVVFTIRTSRPLPVGEQVFLTGNHPALGEWRPDGLPLTRVDDTVWSAWVEAPKGTELRFKITRGSWEAEEILPDGRIPDDRTLVCGEVGEFEHRVHSWRDRVFGPAPHIAGNYRIHEAVHSKHLRFDRRVIVWLPPGYEYNTSERYPVLYMQDGQQVFDPMTSTWGKDWMVDEHCQEMIRKGLLRDVIVVAVYCTEDRMVEYNPSLAGREYARFMIEELKPMIDREYRTLPGRASTALAGSSMGGCISFYLAWTHPDVYFGAACLSPAFAFRDDQYVLEMVRQAEKAPDLRIFLYCGLGDSLERELMGGTAEMYELLRARGLDGGTRLVFEQDPAGQHSEEAWERQTPTWLSFLFGEDVAKRLPPSEEKPSVKRPAKTRARKTRKA